jgi:lactoylglutathione lyase
MFETAFVNLYTRDIEAGIRFYRDLLGFVETFRAPAEGEPEHVELQLGGFMVGLGTVGGGLRGSTNFVGVGGPVLARY